MIISLEQIIEFCQVKIRGLHKHHYKEVDLGTTSEKEIHRIIGCRQYECSGCTRTIHSYDGKMPEYDKYERKENLLKNKYTLK